MPYEENTHLSTGTWRSDGAYTLQVIRDGETIDYTRIDVQLPIYEAVSIDLSSDFEGPSYTIDESSTYFVLTDSSIGPIGGIWWGSSDATPLTIPVRNTDTGEYTHLNVNAWKRSCDLGWGTWWNLNSGQVAEGTCAQWIHLSIGENEHLESGGNYASSAAKPVIFRAMGWHVGEELGRDAYAFEYRAP